MSKASGTDTPGCALGLQPAKAHEKNPHPASSLSHLLPSEKVGMIFPLRGERVSVN
jgi:hypothetical protein